MGEAKKKLDSVLDGLRRYHFEIRHLTIVFVILLAVQIAVSFLYRNSIRRLLTEAQNMYQQDSAERLANLTTTSLELLLESRVPRHDRAEEEARRVIQSLNIIFSQQLLHQNVQEVCLLVEHRDSIFAIDDGKALYAFFSEDTVESPSPPVAHVAALRMYKDLRSDIRAGEQIRTIVEGGQTFHTFVPFAPRGEYVGAVYMKNTPDFSFLTRDLIASYGETAATYLALILFGLIAMFYISSYTLRERNEAQQMLFAEQTRHLEEQIAYQKEMLFTKRIYHTHHKAEKIMGFIKEDLRNLTADNIEAVKTRITRYSNFIARVIYDMKWYDPPVQATRGPIFATDVNEVIRFIVDNIFGRVVRKDGANRFVLDLDAAMPPLPLNEFVVWEVLEPLIQNSVDHGGNDHTTVTIQTRLHADRHRGSITISDNGRGIAPWLLEPDKDGVRRIFREHTSTKEAADSRHAGYGCYLAYEIAHQRCGWELDAGNLPDGGCRFTIAFRI